MTLENLLAHLKRLQEEAKDFYPDDDSKNAGYIEAIKDIIAFIERKHTP